MEADIVPFIAVKSKGQNVPTVVHKGENSSHEKGNI